MKNSKIDDILKGKILSFLDRKWSYSLIIKEFKKQGYIFNKMQLSRIKNEKENIERKPVKTKRKPSGTNDRTVFTKSKILKLKNMASKTNPLPQRKMADKLGTSRQLVNYHLKNTLKFKKYRKRKVHQLNEKQKADRFTKSWKMYCYLKDNLEKVISTDEKLFTLNECNQKSDIQYLKFNENKSKVEPKPKQKHSKGVMVWAGICKNGRTNLYFVKPGIKIDAKYYQNYILRSFIKNDCYRLYLNGDGILQQDSAPSHKAKTTINYLKDNKINFIPPEIWTANSPDNSPCDYFLWSYMLQQLKFKNVTTIEGLKKVLKQVYSEIPQQSINNALDAWPKRCRLIREKRGANIENLL